MAAGDGADKNGFDLDYWLGRCEGFRADSPHGRVGFVEESIAVRAGPVGRLLLIVPVEGIEEILPRGERIQRLSELNRSLKSVRRRVGCLSMRRG